MTRHQEIKPVRASQLSPDNSEGSICRIRDGEVTGNLHGWLVVRRPHVPPGSAIGIRKDCKRRDQTLPDRDHSSTYYQADQQRRRGNQSDTYPRLILIPGTLNPQAIESAAGQDRKRERRNEGGNDRDERSFQPLESRLEEASHSSIPLLGMNPLLATVRLLLCGGSRGAEHHEPRSG